MKLYLQQTFASHLNSSPDIVNQILKHSEVTWKNIFKEMHTSNFWGYFCELYRKIMINCSESPLTTPIMCCIPRRPIRNCRKLNNIHQTSLDFSSYFNTINPDVTKSSPVADVLKCQDVMRDAQLFFPVLNLICCQMVACDILASCKCLCSKCAL